MGKGVIVESPPVRRSAKVFGAVSVEPQPKWYYRLEEERFNGKTFLKFLKQLVRNNKGKKVLLILDNAPYHHTKFVKKWVQKNSSLIELSFLPPYSPDLNATESVWRIAKRASTHNRFFAKLDQLIQALTRAFRRFQRTVGSLTGKIHPFLRELEIS